ncbi:hypothetical protein BCR39DRAFT_588594 [Naematelia encephala]|uniref:Mediator complex subunit 16 n=1 Tax=Naematelia encephala TaxID=71784 RepID=A0A1Y2B1W9_9TREE|nr:hypothetical protein BCR39DRAFT_588594 [Naematelia encephala]
MEVDDEVTAESSKAAQKRFRRMTTVPPALCSSRSAAIHPHTSDLIYPVPAPSLGQLITPLLTRSAPRPLPHPSVTTPGQQVSVSPDGEWVVTFHPYPSTPGGAIAIYPSSILSPMTTAQAIPTHGVFPLSSAPLAITHLYPAPTHTPSGRASARGPRQPAAYSSRQGPVFLVLSSTGLSLYYPCIHIHRQNLDSDSINSTRYVMHDLHASLHTRCHVSHMADTTMLIGSASRELKKGWMGLVGGSEGVWVGWEDVNGPGIARVEIGAKEDQRFYMTVTATPMPRLPDMAPRDTVLQGMVFMPLHEDRRRRTSEEAINAESRVRAVESVAVACIYSEQDSGETRTSVQVLGFERREVEISESFAEISSSGEIARAWDWSAIPNPLFSSKSPANTSVLAIAPLPDVQDRTMILAILHDSRGMTINHIDLFPPPNEETGADDTVRWECIQGEDIKLGELPYVRDLELVLSQSVDRGCLGLAAVISKTFGAVPVVIPALNRDETSPLVDNISVALLLAIKQDVDYSDVIRAVSGQTHADQQNCEFSTTGRYPKLISAAVVSDILARTYTMLENEVSLNELAELLKLQIAFYQSSHHNRLSFAAELVHLFGASRLFSRCAVSSRQGQIDFDLDSVWGLCGVAEWTLTTLAGIFRDIVLARGELEWSPSADLDGFEHILAVLHPELRPLIILVLSQVIAYSKFVLALDRPILQTESRFLPGAIGKDPRATVLVQERMRSLSQSLGVDIVIWGRALTSISKLLLDPMSEVDLKLSLASLSLGPIRNTIQPVLAALPNPSSLFTTTSSNEEEYDAITFLPLQRQVRSTKGIRCIRCGWRTVALKREDRSQVIVLADGVDEIGNGLGWAGWKVERETGCSCGGSWVFG